VEEVLPRLWVGGDADYDKVKDRENWAFVRCCKYGSGGHQQTLGYHTPAAPKGPNYLWVNKGQRLALNMIDLDDPNFHDPEMIDKALEFIKSKLADGKIVLVSCNKGHSRAPTIALMYMRAIGEMPYNFVQSERFFRVLYPDYEPAQGVRQFARSHWADWFYPNHKGKVVYGLDRQRWQNEGEENPEEGSPRNTHA
jgi:hypothetical protein